jgi:hypothetical protein
LSVDAGAASDRGYRFLSGRRRGMENHSGQDLVAREYATTERLSMRRLDRTGWLHGEDEPWVVALRALAEVRPTRVLDAGCGGRLCCDGHRSRCQMR